MSDREKVSFQKVSFPPFRHIVSIHSRDRNYFCEDQKKKVKQQLEMEPSPQEKSIRKGQKISCGDGMFKSVETRFVSR